MPDIKHNENNHRYKAFVDGQAAGFCEYRAQGDTVTFTHTVVQAAFEGQGVGSALARFALEDSRVQGKKVVPACQFIRDYIHQHPEFSDLVG